MRFDAGANVNKALHKGLKGNFGQCKLALSLRINRKEMKKEQRQIMANSSDKATV